MEKYFIFGDALRILFCYRNVTVTNSLKFFVTYFNNLNLLSKSWVI